MEHRRRIVTFNWTSADGYFDTFRQADGNMDWGVKRTERGSYLYAKTARSSLFCQRLLSAHIGQIRP
jgi:hypothetical protein